MTSASIYDATFFDGQVDGAVRSARIILPLLFKYYQPQSIVDVGCGVGAWVKCAQNLGVEDVLGIDGGYIDSKRLLIDQSRFLSFDLTRRIQLDRRFDLAMSLEVAEHLPYERSETLVADLTALSDVVLFSAALPYQGGTHHVNEQWLEFWAILFRQYDYVACDFIRQLLWTESRVEFWYAQNTLVFCRRPLAGQFFPAESVAERKPLSYPHPLTFLVNVARYRPLASKARDIEMHDYSSLLDAYVSGHATIPSLWILEKERNESVPLFPSARTVITDPQTLIDAADRRIRETESETLRVAHELAESRHALAESRHTLAESRHTVEELRNSWSWKLTAPLRAGMDIVLAISSWLR